MRNTPSCPFAHNNKACIYLDEMRDQVGQSVELHEGVSSVEGRRFGDHAALARIARESQRTRAREGIRRVGDARGTVQARSTRARTTAAITHVNAVQSFACEENI